MADFNDSIRYHLTGMYQDWFLEYASYVILERAVPAIEDGLKPVQRRILHAMKMVDDGKMNKVANIVGQTMQYHPHGDASIGDALIQLGQKDLLIDCQGNWGNILTGDGAAAPRYIEARLSQFALEVAFNPKTTEWMMSYDGRKKEPVHLPIKFPLLLAQGVEGIAVGLNSKILPHNFNELCEASLNYLKGIDFQLFPDFQNGGVMDVSRYNDGERGGVVRIRAKITKADDNKSLIISQIPFGTTTTKVIESIIKAQDKGKIKIKKVDDYTAEEVRIVVQLLPGTSSDKTIDALYAFTDCELSISPNCCVIRDRKPVFISVSELLRHSTDNTKRLLQQELLIQKNELEEQYFYTSLEKIFIENRIYKEKQYEEASTKEEVIAFVDSALEPFKNQLLREVTSADIEKLLEIRMIRITRFDTKKADDLLAKLRQEMEQTAYHLEHLVEYTIAWFEKLKQKYGAKWVRRTEIHNFDSINAKTVVEANEKLYINREDGFIGTTLKKDEYIADCSLLDEVIIFYKSGKFKIIKVAEKVFVGSDILHIAIFHNNDSRTVYNVVYRHGKLGPYFMKRFSVVGITRDKEYDITQGEVGSKIIYFSANPNGEAEKVVVKVRSVKRLKKTEWVMDFSELLIKNRGARGNLLTKYDVRSITLKQKGLSTLGGRKVWFDEDVLRINFDGHGKYLGEFVEGDRIMVINKDGSFFFNACTTTAHFERDYFTIEKFDPSKQWTLIFRNTVNQCYYVKRFKLEFSPTTQNFLGEGNEIVFLSDNPQAMFLFHFSDSKHSPMELRMADFAEVRSFKAKPKKISALEIDHVEDISPILETVVDNDIPFSIETNAYDLMTDETTNSDQSLSLFNN